MDSRQYVSPASVTTGSSISSYVIWQIRWSGMVKSQLFEFDSRKFFRLACFCQSVRVASFQMQSRNCWATFLLDSFSAQNCISQMSFLALKMKILIYPTLSSPFLQLYKVSAFRSLTRARSTFQGPYFLPSSARICPEMRCPLQLLQSSSMASCANLKASENQPMSFSTLALLLKKILLEGSMDIALSQSCRASLNRPPKQASFPSCFQYMDWCGWYTSLGADLFGVFISRDLRKDSCQFGSWGGRYCRGLVMKASNREPIGCPSKGEPNPKLNISRNYNIRIYPILQHDIH